MPTPKKGARLGGSAAHQKLIVANLATALFEHGRITTTEAKARVLRPYAERLITKAKKGDLHNRRLVLASIKDKGVVHALFEDIAPRFAERPGGYTRITKLGPRKGDNAPMAVIELVTEDYAPKGSSGKPSRPTAAAPAAPATEEPAAEQPVDEVPADEPAAEAPADEAEVDDAPADGASADEAPVDGAPATDAPAGDAVAGGEPVAEAPGDEPAVEVPADWAPVDEAPADGAPADGAAADEVPAEDTDRA